APGILVLQGRNGGHVTMLRLAPQPAQEHAFEQGGVEPVGLGTPMLAGDGHAGRVDDMSFDAVSPEPARQPEAVAAGLKGDGDAADLPAGLARLCAPTVEELEEGVLVRSKLFERMTRDPRNNPRHQPTRLAHLDDRDNRVVLIQRGKASVQVGWFWHRAAPSLVQRRWCHLLAAGPIASPRRTPSSRSTTTFNEARSRGMRRRIVGVTPV